MAQNVFYEVSLKINSQIYDDFSTWLKTHINEMLTLPGFLSNEIRISYNIKDNLVNINDLNDTINLIVIYRVENLSKMNEYFSVHAKKMRGDGVERFGGKFEVSRRVFMELPL